MSRLDGSVRSSLTGVVDKSRNDLRGLNLEDNANSFPEPAGVHCSTRSGRIATEWWAGDYAIEIGALIDVEIQSLLATPLPESYSAGRVAASYSTA